MKHVRQFLIVAYVLVHSLPLSGQMQTLTLDLAQHRPRNRTLFDDFEWGYDKSYINLGGYAERPPIDVLKTIAVEWQPPVLHPFGRFCSLQGRLIYLDHEKRKPVNWFQGITVFMAKQPGQRPDWITRKRLPDDPDEEVYIEQFEDAEGKVTVPNQLGQFEVHFDLRKIKSDPDRPQSFQFGLSLAQQTIEEDNCKVEWNSTAPAISSTIQMLTVAPVKISRESLLIDKLHTSRSFELSNVDLVRTVNVLRRLGKEQAVQVLEEYIKLAAQESDLTDETYHYNRNGFIPGREDWRHCAPENVIWIARLLFEPVRSDDRSFPVNWKVVSIGDRPDTIWHLNPIEVVDDVPYFIRSNYTYRDRVAFSSFFQFVRNRCVIRDQDIEPTRPPLETAEMILSNPKFKQIRTFESDEWLIGSIRSQAIAMTAEISEPNWSLYKTRTEQDGRWKIELERERQLNIVWDAKDQRYVSRLHWLVPCLYRLENRCYKYFVEHELTEYWPGGSDAG